MTLSLMKFFVSTAGVALLLIMNICNSQDIIKNEYHIEEEIGEDIQVGNPAKDSGFYSKFRKDIHLLMFQPFAQGNERMSYFSVNSSSGVIRTARNIDREIICPGMPKCFIKLGIAVYRRSIPSESPTLLNILDIIVNVHDINDNKPTFPAQAVTLQVSENHDINYQIETSVATDADEEGGNSRITYRIIPSSDMFELSTVKTTDGVEDLVITIKKVLDREEKSLYKLLVVATDLGDDPKSGSLVINIQVTDMNDNTPQFERLNYSVNILENSDVSAPVIIVTASDKDEGQNSRLSYSFSFHVAQEIRDLFIVDANTGNIFSRKQLDFETKHVYQFSVVVSDRGSPSKSSFAYVTINVIDVNDNIPVIQVNPAPGGDTVIEHGSVGKFLAYIKVTDSDSHEYGRVTCDILDPCFVLDLVDVSNLGFYKIKLRKALDREEAPTRDVVIKCRDNDARPLSSSASFEVVIEDINDNAPTFQENSLFGSVMENGPGGFVLQVVATDPDEGENSRVTFALTSESDMPLFKINKITGAISTTGTLDREMGNQYFLEVRASDNGIYKLQSTATVTIDILDENDNPPRFRRQAYFCSVLENLPEVLLSESPTAYDPDSEENSRFVFSILDNEIGSGDGLLFKIDPTTGLLWSGLSFNREEKNIYKFKVKVADPFVDGYYDIANVTVTIMDDNDHAPLVVSPPPANRTFHCPFNMTVGELITVFVATDEDDPRLVDISYNLQNADRNVQKWSLFTIGPTSGKLRLARQIRPEDVATHVLEVIVKDGPDVTAQSSVATISIIVEEGSEEAMRRFTDGSKTNIIIVIIIIAATFILVLIVISFICLIRRVDKKRRVPLPSGLTNVNHKMYQAAKWVSSVSVTKDIGPEEISSVFELPVEKKAKKKEVSFSLDDREAVSPEERESHQDSFCTPLHTARGMDGLPFQMNTRHGDFIVMNGMTTPDFSQHLYDVTTIAVHPQVHDAGQRWEIQRRMVIHRETQRDFVVVLQRKNDDHQFVEVRHADDRFSDASSGDTGTSDSGRGGSEDEGHNHTNSSGDGEMQKNRNGGSLTRGSSSILKASNKRQGDNTNSLNRLTQLDSSTKNSDDFPGSPTPLLSDRDRQGGSHCYIRRSFDTLPNKGRGSPSSAQTLPVPSTPSQNPGYHKQHRYNSDQLKLSHADTERLYLVPKTDQQLLQTFSSPQSSVAPPTSPHPTWRNDNSQDSLWEQSTTAYRQEDNKTTTDCCTASSTDPEDSNLNDVLV